MVIIRTIFLIGTALTVSGCFGSQAYREHDLWPYFELARERGLAPPKTRVLTKEEKATLPKSALERLIATVVPAKPDGNRYLFAVGIEDYLYLPDIAHADNSLRAVTSAFGVALGVPQRNRTVIQGSQATTGYISSELQSLLVRLGPNDTLYFYFAGHSLPAAPGSNSIHLLARDAQAKAYTAASIPMQKMIAAMNRSQARRVWAFMDTSFSGLASQDTHLLGAVAGVGTGSLLDALPDKISLFQATGNGQYANDYPEYGYRLFSYYLAEGLALGVVDAEQLGAHVGEAVTRVSQARGASFAQTPKLLGQPGKLSSGPTSG